MIDNKTKARIFMIASLNTKLPFEELKKEANEFMNSIGMGYLAGTYDSESSYCYNLEWTEDWYSEALQGLLNSISKDTPGFEEKFIQLLSDIAAIKDQKTDMDANMLIQAFKDAGYTITDETKIFKQSETEMFVSIVANYVLKNHEYSLKNAIESKISDYLKLGTFAEQTLKLTQKEKGMQTDPVMDIDAFMKMEEQEAIQAMREIAKPQLTLEKPSVPNRSARTERYIEFMKEHPNERLSYEDFVFLENHNMLHDDKGRLAYEQLVEDIDTFINTVPRALRTEENFKQFMQNRTESDPEITDNSERDDE